MGLDGLFGLKGWQVMYLAEGIPTILVGIATYFVLTNKPEQAKVLTAEGARLAGSRVSPANARPRRMSGSIRCSNRFRTPRCCCWRSTTSAS